jgi:hypothetical protein
MTVDARTTIAVLQTAVQALTDTLERPYGPPAAGETRQVAGNAMVTLCDGDQDRARTLWKLIQEDLGYMPHAVCVALIRASSTENLVPDVTAPEVT